MRIPIILLPGLFLGLVSLDSALGEDAITTSQVQQYMDAVVKVRGFSGSVRVVSDGKPILNGGYGFADLEHQVVNKPTTKFRIGSITKQFTSMAIMILHERKGLDVDDPIGKHLHDAPQSWDGVTIHHLLTHTSGIPSYTSMPDYGKKMMLPQSTEEMIDRFRDKPLDFEIGKEFRYSNSGYFLLGVIIEKVSGKPYERFLEDEIFGPLHMHDTGYDRRSKVLENRAQGYQKDGEGWVHADYLDMSQPYAAGSLYSTVEDLGKWDEALRDRKLISSAGYDKMWDAEKQGYAYGWIVEVKDGQQVQHHGGGINGFASHFIRIPESKVSVAVLSNAMPSEPARLANDLLRMLQGKAVDVPQERKFIHVDRQVLQTFEGKYQSNEPPMALVFKLEADRLVGAPEGQPSATLWALEKSKFYVKEIDAELEFERDEKKNVVAVTINQGGRKLRAMKLPIAEAETK